MRRSLALCGLVALAACKREPEIARTPRIHVTTAVATAETVHRSLELTGTLEDARTSMETTPRPLRVDFSVPQENAAALYEGQSLALTVDALPNRTFRGRVCFMRAIAAQSDRALTVEAVVPNTDGDLRPGFVARVRLALGQPETLTRVPARAVSSSGGVSTVFVIADGHVQARVVAIARDEPESALLASGVDPTERVVIAGLERLFDGLRVAP